MEGQSEIELFCWLPKKCLLVCRRTTSLITLLSPGGTFMVQKMAVASPIPAF